MPRGGAEEEEKESERGWDGGIVKKTCVHAGVQVSTEERRQSVAKERHREGQTGEQLTVRQAVQDHTKRM